MPAKPQSQSETRQLFASYAELAGTLLSNLKGVCLLDTNLNVIGESGDVSGTRSAAGLRALEWGSAKSQRHAVGQRIGSSEWFVALPVQQTDGQLLAALCVQLSLSRDAQSPAQAVQQVEQRLKPLLGSLHRELAAARPRKSKEQTLTERTEELEWLFKATQRAHAASDDQRVLEQLLAAATQRLHSAFGVICIPDKRLCIEHIQNPTHGRSLHDTFAQTKQPLLTWVQRQNRALAINKAGSSGQKFPPCKVLAAPVVLSTGRVIGMLAFFNPSAAADYSSRQVFLTRHLGRQTASLVEAQFDLMTGLYTRSALEQMHAQLIEQHGVATSSVIYIDVDRVHVVNELQGFEIGNELIVRVADLLGPPLLPEGALSARLAGDRFAVFLPGLDARAAGELATKIRGAASRISIGPTQGTVDVTISCGIADVVDMPQGLRRAIAAAEIACKLAKDRGRNRVELYASEDSSMMRHHDDVAAVGKLRSALSTDRLALYAQRIVPLQNKHLPGGYEILMRLRNPDGSLVPPGSLITAAQRYQLLPSIDRWVWQSALRQLTTYRSMLASREISISINISGQSIGDETFVQQAIDGLRESNLPAGCVTIEITEQAAVKNLAQANATIRRLSSVGCRFSLDDFGTGANSLTYLKALQIGYVKIDGSFVRDILTDRRSQATVRGIVELAKGFGIATVAEFVENEEIADYVRKLGVDYAQGYAFGRPEPLQEVLAGLARDESLRLRKQFLEL